jgi:hypothetical protein
MIKPSTALLGIALSLGMFVGLQEQASANTSFDTSLNTSLDESQNDSSRSQPITARPPAFPNSSSSSTPTPPIQIFVPEPSDSDSVVIPVEPRQPSQPSIAPASSTTSRSTTSRSTTSRRPTSVNPPSSGDRTAPIRRVTESNGTTVVLPASYDPQKTYAALVLMPPTNRTATEFFDWAFVEAYEQHQGTPFIVILPGDRGSSSDYSSGEAFEGAIAYYEKMVRDELTTLVPKYNLDASRIGIGGFSLGADLAWAVSMRNADLFSGALLIDSLCTYRNDGKMTSLSSSGLRYSMIAGREEGGEAEHPMVDVKRILDQHRVETKYESIPNASHSEIMNEIPRGMLMNLVDYALKLN